MGPKIVTTGQNAAAEIQRLRRENATLIVANNLLVKRNIVLSERVQELGGYSD